VSPDPDADGEVMMHERVITPTEVGVLCQCCCGWSEVYPDQGLAAEGFADHVADLPPHRPHEPPMGPVADGGSTAGPVGLINRLVAWTLPRRLLVEDLLSMVKERDEARRLAALAMARATLAEREVDELAKTLDALIEEKDSK